MTRPAARRRRQRTWNLIDSGTQTTIGSISNESIAVSATRVVAATLTTEAGEFRHRVADLTIDARDTHQRTYMHEWNVLTQERLVRSSVDMLEELADLGFAWRDISRMVGVSVAAVQKWRKGERTTPNNRQKLASLMAGCDLIVRHRRIEDIGQWFEVPSLVQGVPVTPMDVWAAGEYPLVFDFAMGHLGGEAVLDKLQPDWRERYDSDFEVFKADDGELSIRMKDR